MDKRLALAGALMLSVLALTGCAPNGPSGHPQTTVEVVLYKGHPISCVSTTSGESCDFTEYHEKFTPDDTEDSGIYVVDYNGHPLTCIRTVCDLVEYNAKFNAPR